MGCHETDTRNGSHWFLDSPNDKDLSKMRRSPGEGADTLNRQSLRRTVNTDAGQAPKKNKFGAKKERINGIVFDSKAEAEFYLYLLSKQQNGEIRGFERQVTYTLLDRFKKGKKIYRPIEYVADFVVTNVDGTVDVIDVKGKETREFQIKRKLFEARYHDLHLTIAKKERGAWELK